MEQKQSSVTNLKEYYENLHRSTGKAQTKPSSPAHKKAKARKVFNKFDTDGSGDIDVKEFQVLAFELGLALTDSEAAEFVKEIDTDGNGTIDFEEFYTWWHTDKKLDTNSPERAKQLQILKIKLQSKAFLKNAAVLASSLAKEAEKTKSLKDSTFNSYDMEFTSGDLDKVNSSVTLTHTTSADEAKKVRDVAKADDQTVVVLINVETKAGVDPFELGEIGGSVKAILDMAQGELKYHSFTTGFTKEGDKNLFQLIFTWSESELPELAAVNAIIDALKISRLSAKFESTDKVGSQLKGYASARFGVKVEVDRTVLLELSNSLPGDQKKGLVFLAGLRQVHFSVNLADANTIFTPELFPELYAPGSPHSYRELRELFLPQMAEILTNEQLPSQFVDLYETCLRLLSGLDSIKIALGSNVFALQLEGFPIFEGYLPNVETLKQLKKVTAPQEAGFENIACTVETDGGEVDGYNAPFVTIDSKMFVHCTVKGQNVNMIFTPSSPEYDVIALFFRNPESGFTNPLKHALVWVVQDKPEFSAFDKYNNYTKEQYEADSSETKPVAFVEVPENGGVQVVLPKWTRGKYFFVKLLNSTGPEGGNIDVEYIGFAGFPSDRTPEEFKVFNPAQALRLAGIPPLTSMDELLGL